MCARHSKDELCSILMAHFKAHVARKQMNRFDSKASGTIFAAD